MIFVVGLHVVGAFCLCGYAMHIHAARPWTCSDFSDVTASLEMLLFAGADDPKLRIVDSASNREITFRKYFDNQDDYGISLMLPESLKQKDSTRLRPEILGLGQIAANEPDDNGIAFGDHLKRAYAAAESVWTRIFGLPEDAPHSKSIEGLSWRHRLFSPPMRLTPALDIRVGMVRFVLFVASTLALTRAHSFTLWNSTDPVDHGFRVLVAICIAIYLGSGLLLLRLNMHLVRTPSPNTRELLSKLALAVFFVGLPIFSLFRWFST